MNNEYTYYMKVTDTKTGAKIVFQGSYTVTPDGLILTVAGGNLYKKGWE